MGVFELFNAALKGDIYKLLHHREIKFIAFIRFVNADKLYRRALLADSSVKRRRKCGCKYHILTVFHSKSYITSEYLPELYGKRLT